MSTAEEDINGASHLGETNGLESMDFNGRTPEYPVEVENALASCFPSDDPLERPDFDPVEYINEQFPDEDSLAMLDVFKKEHEERIESLDHDINETIKQQSMTASQAESDVSETQNAIKFLFSKVQEITGKAEKSEELVQEICRDIKQLDFAKRHLTGTITGLKRLHMFITAVDQLEFMADRRQYQEASNLVEAVTQLSKHFSSYSDVPKIRELRDAVAKLKDRLTKQIFEDFESIQEVSADYSVDGEDSAMYYATDSQTPESLAGACAVAGALGTDCRRSLCDLMCKTWLKQYEQEFAPGGTHAALEHTDRRFSWLRRLLNENNDRYATVFPSEWAIDYQLVVEFFRRSAVHLKRVLSSVDPPEAIDSVTLTRALKQSLAFEQEMFARYEQPRGVKKDSKQLKRIASNATQSTEQSDTTLGDDDPAPGEEDMTVDAIRRKHEARRKSTGDDRARDSGHGLINVETEAKERENDLKNDLDSLPTIKGLLSEVFEPYLISHVKQLSQDIVKSLNDQVKQEDSNTDTALTVFPSSTLLLSKFKSAMKHFVTLTRGQGFFDLYKEFKVCFRTYIGILNGKVTAQSRVKIPGASTAETLCFVLNSAEYLSTAIPALEAALRNAVDEAYRDSIDLSEESTNFQSVTSSAIKGLVSGLDRRFDKSLNVMVRTNWLTFTSVGDQSEYVSDFTHAVREYVPPVRRLLDPIFFQKFCGDFTAMTALPKFLQQLIRCKRIGDIGAQQLLIDAYSLKSAFLHMPLLGDDTKSNDDDGEKPLELKIYETWVNEYMHTCELFLKLVGMNVSNEDVVRNFPVLLPDGVMEDLKVVLELRGVKRVDLAPLVQLAKTEGVATQGKRLFQVSASGTQGGMGERHANTAASVAAAMSGSLNVRDAANGLGFSMPNMSAKNKLDLLNAMSNMFETTSSSLQSYTKRATSTKGNDTGS